MLSSFPVFIGGHTELLAEHVNAIIDQLQRSGRIAAAPPLTVAQEGDGWLLRLAGPTAGFWARIGEPSGSGCYDWVRQRLGDNGFEDAADSLRGGGGEGKPAVEMNGREDVALGDVVWLYPGLEGSETAPWYFYAPRSPSEPRRLVFFARLTGESGGFYGYQEVEPDNGTFRDRDGGRVGQVDSDNAAVEASGVAGIAAGTIVLLYQGFQPGDGTGEGQRLVFHHAAGVGGFWALLTRSAVTRADGSEEFSPYSRDEQGLPPAGFAWAQLTFNDLGELVEDAEGSRSLWPLSLAHESNDRADCREGMVVWLRGSSTFRLPRSVVEGDPYFDGWEDDEVTSYLAEREDPDDPDLLLDSRPTFTLWGEQSAWVRLTGSATAGALYPFEVVHWEGELLPDVDADDDGALDPVPDDYDSSLLDADTGAFDDAALEEDPPAEDAPAEDAENLPGWTASTPGGELVTGVVREANGRNDLAAGLVVRAHLRRSAASGNLLWEFGAPATGFWATLTSESGAGGYAWLESYPPVGSDGEALAARSGTAVESTGLAGLAVGSSVWLTSDNARPTVWRFTWGDEPDRVRLLRYDGAGLATLDANTTAPALHSGSVSVTVWPTGAPDFLRTGSYYVGFRLASGSYVICAPADLADGRYGGLISAEDQVLPVIPTFARRIYVGTGNTESGPPRPQVALFDSATSTLSSAAMGQAAFTDDGTGQPEMYLSTGVGITQLAGSLDFSGTCYSIHDTLTSNLRHADLFYNRTWYDGVTGSYSHPVAPGLERTLTFVGGLLISAADVGTASALFSGTFRMDNGFYSFSGPQPPPERKLSTVTVVNGVITDVVVDP